MRRRDELRKAHIASTIWFVLAVAYIFVLALRQAGVRWWVVFSLSGHGVLIVSVLVSLYLFAIFRGISSSQTVEHEHPLTSTTYYAAFYILTPFLGGLAGCLGGTIGTYSISQFLLGIALGTLGVTFLVWVILDPLIGLLELLLPQSRKHRAARLAQLRAERERKQRDRELLLKQVLEREEMDRRHWRELLEPEAQRLARLLANDGADLQQAEREAVGIGVRAWQTGGLTCMKELRDTAISLVRQNISEQAVVDYVSFWWDGIGNWRAKPLGS
ncbi:MAG: hypothetical protein P8Z79_14805 [Sedimentisphaerales bacterium]|jgi:hypothetical protein